MIYYVAVLFLSAIVLSSCSKDDEDGIENWDTPVNGLSENSLTHGYWGSKDNYFKVKFYSKGRFECSGNGDYYGTYKLNKEERCIIFEYGKTSDKSDYPLNDKIMNVSIVDGSLAFVNDKGKTVVLENKKEVIPKASLLGKKYRVVFNSGETFCVKFDNFKNQFGYSDKDVEFVDYNPYDYKYSEIEDGGITLTRSYMVAIDGHYINRYKDYGSYKEYGQADYAIGSVNYVRNDTIFGWGFKMYRAK